MKPILGKPMLLRQVERARRATVLDALVIATSDDASDDPIDRLCDENGLVCYRGSLNDVLDRFYRVAKERSADHVVRLTGDCPLIDPELIDGVAHYCIEGGFDYASNAVKPTFPDGLDVEVFKFECLEASWREATLASQREHVTPFIRQQPDRFKIGRYQGAQDLSYLRWTVDEMLDFELVKMVYESLYPIKPDFTTSDILALLDRRPELKTINVSYKRNEGYQRSLVNDAGYTGANKDEGS